MEDFWTDALTMTAQLSIPQQQYVSSLMTLLDLQHAKLNQAFARYTEPVESLAHKRAQGYDEELLQIFRSELDHQLQLLHSRTETAEDFESLHAPPEFQRSHAVFALMMAEWAQAARDYAALQAQSAQITSPDSGELKESLVTWDMLNKQYPRERLSVLELAGGGALLNDLKQILNQPMQDSDEEIRWALEYFLGYPLSSEDVKTLRRAPEIVRYHRLLVSVMDKLGKLRDRAEQPELETYKAYKAVVQAAVPAIIGADPMCKEVPARRRELIAYIRTAHKVLNNFPVPEAFGVSHQKYLNFLQERITMESQNLEKLKPICDDLEQQGESGRSTYDFIQQIHTALHPAATNNLSTLYQGYHDRHLIEIRQVLTQHSESTPTTRINTDSTP